MVVVKMGWSHPVAALAGRTSSRRRVDLVQLFHRTVVSDPAVRASLVPVGFHPAIAYCPARVGEVVREDPTATAKLHGLFCSGRPISPRG